jgi:hypothetical protein
MSKDVPICMACLFPLRRGRVPIVWPGVFPVVRLHFCCLQCAEQKGVRMSPRQRAMHKKAEEVPK